MKVLIAVCSLLLAGVAQAAPVTIDFEEFAVGTSGPLQSKGYSIDGDGLPGYPGSVVTGKAFEVIGWDYQNQAAYISVNISRSDAGAFALYSIDTTGSFAFANIVGTRAGGGTVVGSFADLGSGDWLNITQAYLSFSMGAYFGDNVIAGTIDNIVVAQASAVPLPATVWLFVSALGGLGLMRRRSAAH